MEIDPKVNWNFKILQKGKRLLELLSFLSNSAMSKYRSAKNKVVLTSSPYKVRLDIKNAGV